MDVARIEAVVVWVEAAGHPEAVLVEVAAVVAAFPAVVEASGAVALRAAGVIAAVVAAATVEGAANESHS